MAPTNGEPEQGEARHLYNLLAIFMCVGVPLLVLIYLTLLRFQYVSLLRHLYCDVNAGLPRHWHQRPRRAQSSYNTFQQYAGTKPGSAVPQPTISRRASNHFEGFPPPSSDDEVTGEPLVSAVDLLDHANRRIAIYRTENWNCPDLSVDMVLHNVAMSIQSEGVGRSELRRLERMIDYRERTMKYAVRALKRMSIPQPTHPNAFDCALYLRDHVGDRRFWALYNIVLSSRFIPLPKKDEGSFHPRPIIYVAAGCQMYGIGPEGLGLLFERAQNGYSKNRPSSEGLCSFTIQP